MLRIYKYIAVSVLLTSLFALGFTSFTFAKISSSEQVIVVAVDEVIDDDLFITGEEITISGTVNGDVYAAGGLVIIDGTINGDVLAAGGIIEISGTVRDDVRVAGGNITLRDLEVGDSVNTFGGTVNIGDNTKIGGGLVFGSGILTSQAEVGRGMTGGGGTVTLGGKVVQNVIVGTERLTTDAEIGGDVTYYSSNDITIQPDAQISGKVEKILPKDFGQVPLVSIGIGAWITAQIWSYLSALLVGLVLLRLFPNAVSQIAQTIKDRPWSSLGWGVVVLFVTPPALITLMVTLIGIPLAVIGFVLYGLEIYLAQIFVGVLAGKWLQEVMNKPQISSYLSLSLGLGLYFVLTSIPILDFFISTASVFFALGAAFTYKRQLLS